MSLTYTNSVNIPETVFFTSANLSADGRLAWVVFYNALNVPLELPTSTELLPPAAVLYQNDHGVLVELARVPVDPYFPFVAGGSASEDFSVLTLTEENGLGSNRVRVFSRSSLPEPTVIIPVSQQALSASLTTIQGVKTLSNRFITVTYLLNGTAGELAVVDLQKTEVVRRIPLPGYSNTGGLIFQAGCRVDVAVDTVGVELVNTRLRQHAPALLQVYHLKRAGARLLDSTELPSGVQDLDVVVKGCTARIAVSTRPTDYDGRPPIIQGNFILPNFTGEPTGVRVFNFRKRLELVALETYNSGTSGARAVGLSPDGRYLNVTFAGSSNPVAIDNVAASALLTYKIGRHGLQLLQANEAPGNSYVADFSQDGRWVISAGGSAVRSPIADIVLYRVDGQEN